MGLYEKITDRLARNSQSKPQENDKKTDFTARGQLFILNRIAAKPKVYSAVYFGLSFIAFLFLNYLIHVATAYLINVKEQGFIGASSSAGNGAGIFSAFDIRAAFAPYYALFFILVIVGYIRLAVKMHIAQKDINLGQKGTAEWTSREELLAQYPRIPIRGERGTKKNPGEGWFDGGGGVIIARDGDYHLIDPTSVNSLIVGITRSGKGEMEIFPMIDILSRAEKQSSIIISDPKLELYSGSAQTLRKRGYDVFLFNLIDPQISMGFNPLTEIVRLWKSGTPDELDTAKNLAMSLAFSIFSSGDGGLTGGEDKYFQDTSSGLFAALILAVTDNCIKADRELEQRRQARIAEYEEQLGHSVRNASELPADIPREAEYPNEKKINIYSIASSFIGLANVEVSKGKTALDRLFDIRGETDEAALLYYSTRMAGDRQMGNVFSSMLSALRTFITSESIKNMTSESLVNFMDIGFGRKPVAIFMGLPTYDTSNFFLCTVFMSQMLYMLGKMAAHAPGQKCYREIHFLLDEFGNIPALPNMDVYISQYLGIGVKFTIVLQNFGQLMNRYGEEKGEIIFFNCGNTVYIQTKDKKTAEDFSEMLGKRTITTANRTGRMTSLNKEFTEMLEEQSLLNPTELTQLKPGETIVLRSLYRSDLKGNPVRPKPIRNLGEHRLKYRYEYLSNEHEKKEDFTPGKLPYLTNMTMELHELIRSNQLEEIANGERPAGTEYPEEPDVLDIPVERIEQLDMQKSVWSAKAFIKRDTILRASLADVLTPEELRYYLDEVIQLDEEKNKEMYDGFISGKEGPPFAMMDMLATGKMLAMRGRLAKASIVMELANRYLSLAEPGGDTGTSTSSFAVANRGTDTLYNITHGRERYAANMKDAFQELIEERKYALGYDEQEALLKEKPIARSDEELAELIDAEAVARAEYDRKRNGESNINANADTWKSEPVLPDAMRLDGDEDFANLLEDAGSQTFGIALAKGAINEFE